MKKNSLSNTQLNQLGFSLSEETIPTSILAFKEQVSSVKQILSEILLGTNWILEINYE